MPIEKEVMETAIANVEQIIEVAIKDMAMGASYVRAQSSSCLDMINLKKELQARLPKDKPAKAVKKKAAK